MIGTIILQFMPNELIPHGFGQLSFGFPKTDTIGHFISFFLLTWLVHTLLKIQLIISIMTTLFYAILTEVGQYYLTFRSADITDLMADITGVFGFMLFRVIYLKYKRMKLSSNQSAVDNTLI